MEKLVALSAVATAEAASWNASSLNRIRACAISARRSTPTVHSIRSLASWSAPTVLVAVVAQSISVVGQFPRHVHNILLAQRSRGFALGRGPVGRLKALIMLVLPLVSRLLLEAGPRSVALASRGFASVPMSAPHTPLIVAWDYVAAPICILGLILTWIGFGG